MLRQREDAEDVAQDAFIKAYRNCLGDIGFRVEAMNGQRIDAQFSDDMRVVPIREK